MKGSRALWSCARSPPVPLATRQHYISSSRPRPSVVKTNQSRPTFPRDFSTTSALEEGPRQSASSPPNNGSKPSNPMQDLIRDIRGPDASPSQNETGSRRSSASSDWAELLSIARQSASPTQSRSSTNPSRNPTTTVSSMLNSLDEELSATYYQSPTVTLRLRPTLGRTVDNLTGDPTRGFQALERKCRENNIRMDARSQDKHVRRGQRRKNIRISRWRKLFMEGFKSELDTIRRMRKQGW